jgi:hypothetical protein
MNNKTYLSKEESKAKDEWKSADAEGKNRKSGIIYWNHQPGKNYFSANGAGDNDMKTDILMSEVSKLIVGNKKKVVELLNLNGIKTSNSISLNALANKVGRTLYSNPAFSKSIALEIVQKGNNMSADGEKFAKVAGAASDAAKNLNDLIGNVFGGKSKNQKQAQEATQQLQDNTDAVNKMNKGSLGATDYILIALGVSLVIGATIYIVKR